jgi:hypothetical protein
MGGLFEVVGVLLIALSSPDGALIVGEYRIPEAFFAGVLAVSIGGCFFAFSSFHVSFLWKKHQTLVLAAVSCLFDGSTVVFAVFYFIHETFGLSRRTLFLAFAVVTIFVASAVIIGWNLNSRASRKEPSATPNSAQATPFLEEEALSDVGEEPQAIQDVCSESQELLIGISEASVASDFVCPPRSQLPLVGRSFVQQIQTFEYFFIVIMATVHVLRSNFYLGTVGTMLEDMGDADTGYATTRVVGYAIPMGFCVIPFIGAMVERFGLVGAFQIVNILGIIYNCLNLVPILKVQIVTAFVYTTYRAFLFSIIATFNAQIFGLRTMGRIQGCVFVIAGFANLLCNPLLAFTQRKLHGDFSWPIIVQLGTVIPLVVLTEVLRCRFARSAIQ